MTDEPPMTFHWAPEIEVSTVSILWHEPERLAEFLRVCDPLIHLTRVHLRIILEAIGIAYGELNCADWATVVEVVRELGRFEECGRMEGLNAVYSAVDPGLPHTDIVFSDYIRMLQIYAEHRQMDPPRPVTRFSGGRGTVYRNRAKRRALDADFTGDCIVQGKRYQVRLDVAPDGNAANLRLEPVS